MRRTILPALMTALLLLSACSPAAELAEFKSYQETLREAERVSFTAHITAETDGAEFACTLDCVDDGETAELTLVEPSLIAGVSVQVSEGRAALAYGGAVLELGELTGTELTPLTAIPELLGALREGHAELLWHEQLGETDLTAVQLLYRQSETVTVWLTPDELTPVCAELANDGETLLRCTLEDFCLST